MAINKKDRFLKIIDHAMDYDRCQKTRTTSHTVIAIVVVLGLVGVVPPISIQAFAAAVPQRCSTCAPRESITGNGIGDLTCSNGITYRDTRITFNAVAPVRIVEPAQGSVTLTANSTLATIQGTITSGVYDPRAKTYSLSGTSTSDDICGTQNSPFTISGPIGSSVPISMAGANYDFKGTGNVKAAHARA
jgi:hypothetical protein